MDYYIAPVAKLIDEFEKLPGIGHKTAERLAFHVLDMNEADAESFANAVINAKKTVCTCRVCQNLSDSELCKICASPKRDNTTVCVVENPRDVIAMEKTHEYNGLYHVLHGALSPMDGVSPEDIKIKELVTRLGHENIKEIILATGTTVEGEATAMYIARLLRPFGIKVSRIAHGIPIGGDLEYSDEVTIARAIEGRRELK
mgnify:CR=1 FL=1